MKKKENKNALEFVANGLVWTMAYKAWDSPELDDPEGQILGRTIYFKQHIDIAAGMSEELTRQTVIHELAHAFLFSYGWKRDRYYEEDVCNIFGAYGEKIVSIADYFLDEIENV